MSSWSPPMQLHWRNSIKQGGGGGGGGIDRSFLRAISLDFDLVAFQLACLFPNPFCLLLSGFVKGVSLFGDLPGKFYVFLPLGKLHKLARSVLLLLFPKNFAIFSYGKYINEIDTFAGTLTIPD